MKDISEEEYHIVEFETGEGIVGQLGLDKLLFDEDDHEEVSFMVIRVVDAWLKQRSFVHGHIDQYKQLC